MLWLSQMAAEFSDLFASVFFFFFLEMCVVFSQKPSRSPSKKHMSIQKGDTAGFEAHLTPLPAFVSKNHEIQSDLSFSAAEQKKKTVG